MKALTLTQPWATFVALGLKRIETRSWPTSYRGPLAIHAAKGFPGWVRDLCESDFADVLGEWKLRISDFPRGVIVARTALRRCQRTETLLSNGLSPLEQRLGDYAAGRWGFVFGDIERLAVPIPAKGALGLWDWEGC